MRPSDEHFERALRLIPWGTQTNAKRPYPAFAPAMPKYIVRGKGCKLWDMEGKEYIDFRLALGPVTLGYCYDEVDEAVREQLSRGVLFSMASPIELELAELVHAMVPNAEMVRFMKTGEDANLSNIRIARAYMKRDMILMSGYHGYPDWFQTEDSPNNGVPSFMKEYVKIIPWGDCETADRLIRKYADRLACVISTPYDFNEDTSGDYIRFLRKATRRPGHPAGHGRDPDRLPARAGRGAGVLRGGGRPCGVCQGHRQRIPPFLLRRARRSTWRSCTTSR